MRYRMPLLAPEISERDPVVLRAQLGDALAALSQLTAPRPAHRHLCSSGHTWFCMSPYCEPPFDVECPEHGGSPIPDPRGVERWS